MIEPEPGVTHAQFHTMLETQLAEVLNDLREKNLEDPAALLASLDSADPDMLRAITLYFLLGEKVSFDNAMQELEDEETVVLTAVDNLPIDGTREDGEAYYLESTLRRLLNERPSNT